VKEISYFERQRMSPWILIITALIMTGTTILFSNGDIKITLPVLITLVVLAVLYFVFAMQTVIDDNGLYVKFSILQWKYRFIAWTDVEQAYIRQYNPLFEYGGWGCRVGMKKGGHSNIAYNMQGNIGLQLVLKNGNKVLIGTRCPEAIDEIIKALINRGVIQAVEENQ